MDGQIKYSQRGDKYKKKTNETQLSSTPQILSPLLINHNISTQVHHINVWRSIITVVLK